VTHPVASTPSPSGPDWQSLAAQVTEFLGALAATVAPSPEQQEVAERFEDLVGALGRPTPGFEATIDKANRKVITVDNPPVGAYFYRVGDFTNPKSKLDEGPFDVKTNSITLKKVDPATEAKTFELYDKDKNLIARGRVRP